MITAQINRRRQNDRAATGRFRETCQKVIARDNRCAMYHRSQELFEIFPTQRAAMFLIAKHYRVIEIENDAAIGSLQETELEFVKADCFEKHDDVVLARFSQNPQPLRHAGTSRGN